MNMNLTIIYKDDLENLFFEDVGSLTLRGGWVSFQSGDQGYHINRDTIDSIITEPMET